MRRRLIRAALVPAALMSLLLAGCAAAGGGGETPASEDALIVYNAQHEQLTEEWVAAFTEETGIEVSLRNGGDSELANQLVAEGAASPADVFLTENSPAMSLVEDAGLFAPVDASTLDARARTVSSVDRRVDRDRCTLDRSGLQPVSDR